MRSPGQRMQSKALVWCAVMFGIAVAAGATNDSRTPDLVLITIDTLRADHLSVNGAQNVATPNLDRLARAGVNFSRARSPVPLTLPSHASILTGHYPPTHGIRDNASSRLAESQLTLSEVLRSKGYETAAFLGSFVLDRRFGLNQGFEVYDDHVGEGPEDMEKLEAERSAEDVFSAFDSWLSARESSRPFFAWLHFYDPHAPYNPPEPFTAEYRADPYAGEVAYVDEVIGRVVGRFEEEDSLQKTVIAVVGDHGEGLGEHGERTHSLLIYNSTLHVPMILFAPGRIEPGAQIDSLVRTIDLPPTLLDLLGHPQSFGEGRSLMTLISRGDSDGQAEEPGPSAYSESLYAKLNLGWSSVRGVETDTHRLILGPEAELYDVRVDPKELHDIADVHPEIVSQLRKDLETREADLVKTAAAAPTVDPETVEQLRSLGYLTGASTPGAVIGRDGEVNPRKYIGDWEHIEKGLLSYARGDFGIAAERFSAVLKSHPDTPLLYEYLGSCYERLGKTAEAERIYREARSRGIESPEFHLGLARVSMEKGDSQAAEEELLNAIELDPLSVVAHHTLGDVYRGGKEFERAQEQYQLALEINPAYVYAWNGLGMTLGSLKDDHGALEAFQQAVNVAPQSPLPYMNLAVQLERMEQIDEARSAYRTFLDLSEGREELNRERSLAEAALDRLGS